eukprot:926795-Amphidinium_carterae.1
MRTSQCHLDQEINGSLLELHGSSQSLCLISEPMGDKSTYGAIWCQGCQDSSKTCNSGEKTFFFPRALTDSIGKVHSLASRIGMLCNQRWSN